VSAPWVERLRRAGRAAAEAALQQPAVRQRVEAAQARIAEVRKEVEHRLMEAESDLWAWLQMLERDARKAQRQQQRARDASDLFRTFGLRPNATLDEVKRAYRERMRTVHPDRFAHDPAAEARAHARAQALNHAYAELVALLTGRESRRSG